MKKLLPASIIMLLSFSCFINKIDNKATTIVQQSGSDGIPVTISIIKGDQWSHEMKLAGPLKANILPQIVIWSEKPDGSLLETIYVTGAHKKTKGHATKSKKGAQFWKECFPFWASRMTGAGKKLPQEEGADFDSVTSATPMSTFTLDTKINSINTPFKIFAEINKSADYNKAYIENKNEWVGQPALIYSETITTAQKGREYILRLTGFDDPGKESGINADTSRLDTALMIVKEIKLIFQ